MPLYQKYNSYGEYVFDWSWADAYRSNGIPYYPKFLTAPTEWEEPNMATWETYARERTPLPAKT